MDVLEQVKEFARQAHGEQMRKYGGDRYIVHPIRVMELCRKYTDEVSVLAAALMHDVLEDTEVTAHEIETFLSGIMSDAERKKTVKLVKELTDEFVKQNYPRLNRKMRKSKEADRLEKVSAEAQTIKYADIIDNAREIVSQDAGFGSVYLKECSVLLEKMDKGYKELYLLAQQTIKSGFDELKKIKS
jgi:guanosine-3',5'-bis(diphosphate) 3'-pyrophosphohydrolase